MPNNLIEAFNEAKKHRQVLSKSVIYESGVSKSQFYRILSGKEAPSPETKERICKSLNIDAAEFDRLHKRSSLESKAQSVSPVESKSHITYLAIAIAALIIGALFVMGNNSSPISQQTPTESIAKKDDKTLFIKDVTIPDGTVIPVNTTYIKTWRVKNTGSIVWKHRYLKRITPASELLCSSPAMVPIPETAPGEIVDISVTFTTPHLPGSCRTDWKTADDRGNFFFPHMHGLFSIVVVSE